MVKLLLAFAFNHLLLFDPVILSKKICERVLIFNSLNQKCQPIFDFSKKNIAFALPAAYNLRICIMGRL